MSGRGAGMFYTAQKGLRGAYEKNTRTWILRFVTDHNKPTDQAPHSFVFTKDQFPEKRSYSCTFSELCRFLDNADIGMMDKYRGKCLAGDRHWVSCATSTALELDLNKTWLLTWSHFQPRVWKSSDFFPLNKSVYLLPDHNLSLTPLFEPQPNQILHAGTVSNSNICRIFVFRICSTHHSWKCWGKNMFNILFHFCISYCVILVSGA